MFTDLVKKNVPLGNGEIERKKRERDGEQSIKNIDERKETGEQKEGQGKEIQKGKEERRRVDLFPPDI